MADGQGELFDMTPEEREGIKRLVEKGTKLGQSIGRSQANLSALLLLSERLADYNESPGSRKPPMASRLLADVLHARIEKTCSRLVAEMGEIEEIEAKLSTAVSGGADGEAG